MVLDLRFQIAGSIPAAAQSSATLEESCSHTFASVTKQYINLVLTKARRSKQAHRAAYWSRVCGVVVYAGIWLRAEESEIEATLWTKWSGKNSTFFYFSAIF